MISLMREERDHMKNDRAEMDAKLEKQRQDTDAKLKAQRMAAHPQKACQAISEEELRGLGGRLAAMHAASY